MSSSFTAHYAHKRAMKNAQRLTKDTSMVSCMSCKGTGQMSLSVSVLGESTSTVHSVPCVHCKDGIIHPVKQLYTSLIWCDCKHAKATNHIRAADGVRVFGNTTYLCGHCGFVKQFG